MAGGAGSGKSRFLFNLATLQLANRNPILFITFERAASLVLFEIRDLIGKLGLKVKVLKEKDLVGLEGLRIVDFFGAPITPNTPNDCCNEIKTFLEETSGKFVLIDSITELTAYAALKEANLRLALKAFINNLGIYCKQKNREVAIVASSQFRGSFQAEHIAGGPAISHLANAVIELDRRFVTQFDRGYYASERGVMIRSIRIDKTDMFFHSPFEHEFNIDDSGVVTVNPPFTFKAYICNVCRKELDPTKEDYAVVKGKRVHVSCLKTGEM